MSCCTRCQSYAINPHLHGRDGSRPDLCDVCYWRNKAERVTTLAQYLLYACQHVLGVLEKPPPNKPGGVSRAYLRNVITLAETQDLKPVPQPSPQQEQFPDA